MLVERVKDLYVLLRKKYIIQKKDGSYAHVGHALHDSKIRAHLEGKITLGVFAGEVYTKWLCFDVDTGQQLTRELIYTLEQEFNISRDCMLVSFSGNKGYHVELFFENPVYMNDVRLFYEDVLKALEANSSAIELRPTATQGVKLPLSIHRATGAKCCYVDSATLIPIEDEAIFKVRKLIAPPETILLDQEQIESFEKVWERTNLDIPIDYEERCITMLAQNKLLYPNSRHHSSLLLLAYLHSTGYEENEAVAIVCNLLANTFIEDRELINASTTLEYAQSEVRRLWPYATRVKLDISVQKVVRLFDKEIEKVLEPPKAKAQQLLFSLLVHSKKWANKQDIFYMSYKQMALMGNDSKRSRLLTTILELEKEGYLEVIQRNRKRLPNKYRLNILGESKRYLDVETIEVLKLEQVATQLLAEVEVKQLLSKSQFYNHYKHYYL